MISPPNYPEKRFKPTFFRRNLGVAATTWLAKALNSHPEILCLHAGTDALNTFHHSVEDCVQYFRVLIHLGHGYGAVEDVHGLPRWDVPKWKVSELDLMPPLSCENRLRAFAPKWRSMNNFEV